ncbi:MAG: 16S rRNA (adenine(1518)-N(6)/adenine(1519)-N(6))-dimethyltransferase RsmA [Gemmatimonadota bacterium]
MPRGDAPRRAKKSLGQNFLVDRNLQLKIVDALGAEPHDDVVEIGPGQGALTRHLVDRCRRLVLVELDDHLAAALQDEFSGAESVEVVHGDVLRVDLPDRVERFEDTLVIGNIPYNITTPIIFRLLATPRPRGIVLMVQEEVADRIVADVGTKSYGALSVGVRLVADVQKLFRVRRGSFRPVPGVDSAVIRIVPRRPAPLDPELERVTRVVVRAAFQWRRKQLGTILRSHPDLGLGDGAAEVLGEVGLPRTIRPERLSPEDFSRLGHRVAAAGGRI